jgi:RimJ/RimL family protein N-acetyltransferase
MTTMPADDAPEPLRGRWTASHALREADLAFLYELLLDPVVGAMLRYQGATPSFDDFARHAWDGVLAQWLVRAIDSNEPLGVVVVSSPDFRNGYAYLSVLGRAELIGSGVMMDGVAAVLEHVFATWPFRRLYFEAADESFDRFASGLGRFFVEEGVRREQVFARGRYQDVHLLTLTRESWAQEAAPLWQRLRLRAAGRRAIMDG